MECNNCGNDVNFVGVGTMSQNLSMCPVCGNEKELDDEELENEIFDISTKIINPEQIRKMPVRTEQDVKLKVAEVVYRVGRCVFNNALKKYTAELKRNLTGQVVIETRTAGLDLDAIRWAGL